MAWVNIVGDVVMALLIMLIICVVGILTWLFFEAKKYKHKVRIRKVINGRVQVYDTKAKEYKDKQDTVWWKTSQPKAKFSVPPNDAIDIDNKGCKVYECYQLGDNTYIPIRDKGLTTEEHQAQIKAIAAEQGLPVESFQPLSTQERALLVQEVVHSHQYNKNKTLSQLIEKALPYMAMVIIITVLLVFWSSAVDPMIKFSQQQEATLDKWDQILAKADQVVNDRQYITGTETHRPNEGGVPD